MVKSDCESPPNINSYIKKLFDVYTNTAKIHRDGTDLEIIQFSDSTVFSLPYSKEDFSTFIKIVSTFQYDLLKQGLLCRGGIAYGKHFSSEGFLFSNALIEAYKLEKNFAKYPRVVVSNDLLDLIYKSSDVHEDVPLIKENDDLIFVDFLSECDLKEAIGYLDLIINSSKFLDSSVKEKHRWLMEYFDFKASSSLISKFAMPRFSRI